VGKNLSLLGKKLEAFLDRKKNAILM
jgi:hypothetical protein